MDIKALYSFLNEGFDQAAEETSEMDLYNDSLGKTPFFVYQKRTFKENCNLITFISSKKLLSEDVVHQIFDKNPEFEPRLKQFIKSSDVWKQYSSTPYFQREFGNTVIGSLYINETDTTRMPKKYAKFFTKYLTYDTNLPGFIVGLERANNHEKVGMYFIPFWDLSENDTNTIVPIILEELFKNLSYEQFSEIVNTPLK